MKATKKKTVIEKIPYSPVFLIYLIIGKLYTKKDIEANGGTVVFRDTQIMDKITKKTIKLYLCILYGNLYHMEAYSTTQFKCKKAIISNHKMDGE